MFKVNFYVFLFIFLGLQVWFVYAMEKVEGVREKGGEGSQEEVLYEGESRELDGRDLLIVDPEKKFRPMIVKNFKSKLTCQDPKKRLFVVDEKKCLVFTDQEVQVLDSSEKIDKKEDGKIDEGIQIQDPIEKNGQKEEDKKDNLALEGFGNDLGVVEQELVERGSAQKLSKKVEKTETDLLAEFLANHLKSKNILSELKEKDKSKDSEKDGVKAKVKGKKKDKNKEKESEVGFGLLDMCKRAIQEDSELRELAKKIISEKKETKRVSKSMIGNLANNMVGNLDNNVVGKVANNLVGGVVGLVENLESFSTGDSSGSTLLTKICDFALRDSQKQKENANKLETEKKKTENKNRCLSLGTVIVGVASLLTGASSIIKIFGLDIVIKDLIIGSSNSTAC